VTKKAWEIIIIIVGIGLDVLTLIKEKLGGKHDAPGTAKKE
jgi:hypothetical protein